MIHVYELRDLSGDKTHIQIELSVDGVDVPMDSLSRWAVLADKYIEELEAAILASHNERKNVCDRCMSVDALGQIARRLTAERRVEE